MYISYFTVFTLLFSLQFDVCFVYFTRLDRGPISEPTSIEMSEAKMSTVSLFEVFLKVQFNLLSHEIISTAFTQWAKTLKKVHFRGTMHSASTF